jgi:hypothetical protein
MAAGLPCHTALEFFSKYPPLSGPCSSSIRVDLPSFAGYFPPSAIRSPVFSSPPRPRVPVPREPCRAEKNNELCKEILFFFA